MNERTWEVNAQEFKELDKGNGWPFAILVACSVEKRKAGGNSSTIIRSNNGKVSANQFAEMAGTTQPRIHRILASWQKIADRGLVVDASTLTPSDVGDVVIPDIAWMRRDARIGGEWVYDASVPRSTPRARTTPVLASTPTKPVVVAESVAKPEPERPQPVATQTKKEAAAQARQELDAMGIEPFDLSKINTPGDPMLDGLSEYADKTKLIRKHTTALIDLLDGVADLRVFGDKTTNLLGELVDSIAPHLMGVK